MTKIQSLIENALHARDRKATFGMSVKASTIVPNHGFLPSHVRCRGEVKMCARGMNRAILECGACVDGRIPKRDGQGDRVGEWSSWPKHEDCQGLGLRINRRFGRCGNGRLR